MSFDSLTISRLIATDRSRAWSAFTTADGLARWWWSGWPDTTYSVDAVVGGQYRIAAADHGIAVHGAFRVVDRPNRLVFSWVWADDGVDGLAEEVTVDFDDDAAGTWVHVHHTGPWTTAEPAENYRQGWEFVLDALTAEYVDQTG